MAEFISFSSGIVSRIHDLDAWPLASQMEQRCANMQQNAKALDSNLHVLGVCVYTSAGYVYTPVEVK
jgi:hypothetical protein